MRSAFITGLAGQQLTADEAAFLRDATPAGLILFARNIVAPAQVRALIDSALEAVGSTDTLVLIDQEGGRVQRLRPPHWRALPPARAYARLSGADTTTPHEAARLVAQLTATDLRALGINCNCAPVLDVPVPGAHDIIDDRAYATDVASVVAFGRAVVDGHLAGGVVPVIKHIPGHGRATADSHLALPTVTTPRAELEASDFAPFRALADAPAAMTAHVVFSAIDPAAPASTSRAVHDEVLRGHLGYAGLLMSDDLSMKALAGPMRARAEAVIAAGSDLALHCNGDMSEMRAVAAGAGGLDGAGRTRFERALAATRQQAPLDQAVAEACLVRVLALSA